MTETFRTPTRRRLLLGLATLPAAAALSACAPAGAGHLPQATRPLVLEAELTGGRRSYRIGEVVSLRLRVSEDAQVAILNIDAEGRVTVLRPNPLAPSTSLPGGVWQQFPPPGADFVLQVAPPPGRNEIRILATPGRAPLLPPQQLRPGADGFDRFEGGAAALDRLIVAQPGSGSGRTVERRLRFRVIG